VVDAITMAKRLAADSAVPRPIFVLGQIVHNRHVVDQLSELGIITLDGGSRLALLDEVPAGATVIFTAHGVSPLVKAEAQRRGFRVYDATCPDVTRTHDLIRTRIAEGFFVIYIGTPGHPEPEGAMGEAPSDRICLVANAEQVESLTIPPEQPVAVMTQTTLSQWDTQSIIDTILRRFPHAEIFNEICMATQSRQEAAVKASESADLVVVVGDRRSNNSNRLVEVVEMVGKKRAVRVESADDLREDWFLGIKQVAVTAGSSTPTEITRAVISQIERWNATVVPSES
jgi:4-hydroxy-3-methylbut-2-enyl diphosphate reductase